MHNLVEGSPLRPQSTTTPTCIQGPHEAKVASAGVRSAQQVRQLLQVLLQHCQLPLEAGFNDRGGAL